MARRTRPWRTLGSALGLCGALAACTPAASAPPRATEPGRATVPAPAPDTSTHTPTMRTTQTRSPSPALPAPPTPSPGAVRFDVDAVLAQVGVIVSFGPRDAVSPAFARSAAYVAGELSRLGYRVQRQVLRVPAGRSWGVPVAAGTTSNVVADPPGFDPGRPHVLIGAHLDTVPQAPGAEDNASGVAVLLELARMLRQQPAALPVRFVAFAAEEARGRGEAAYAFGSRHYVARLTAAQRRAVVAMVALDRVGVRSGTVPVCSGGRRPATVAASLRGAARAVPTTACRNRASDHWSFEAAGLPAARVGSVPYPQYHSASDLPTVLDRRQLERVGAVLWSWLRSARA